MKLLKILLILLIAIFIDIVIFTTTTYALNNGTLELYSERELPIYLNRKDNEGIKNTIIYCKNMYYNNIIGNKMPAYSLNSPSPTKFSTTSESVNIKKVVPLKLWQIITNGYPYVSYSELGCNNEEEAYVATQFAAYCFFNNSDIESYLGVEEAGKRIFNAAKFILESGKSSQSNRVDSNLDIIPDTNEWKIENSNLFKIYKVSAKANFKNYRVYITSDDKELTEKIKVVDMNNQNKEEFEATEQFKIIIPIEQIKDCGKFDINISAQVETKPIYLAEREAKSIQRYAITDIYEEGKGKLNEEFKITEKEEIVSEKKLPQTGL